MNFPMAVFTQVEKNPKIYVDHTNTHTHTHTRITKAILRKNKVDDITFPDFRLYCKATIIKTKTD